MEKANPQPMHPLLIQVLPQLKPTRCGVSDQAVRLAAELKSAFAIETAFVVLNSNERCEQPFPVCICTSRELLAKCIELSGGLPAAMLVHLSGYGYSADGAPRALADALDRVRADGRYRIAVYFHELFARGMPWKSCFWHSFRQRKVVRRIAEGCDLRATSVEYYAAWLEGIPSRRTDMPVLRLPVFSAVGEASTPVPFAAREESLAVFGLPGTRQRAYRVLAALPQLLHGLGIRKIVDIGAECGAPRSLADVPVEKRGVLDALELPDALSRIRFGFITNTADRMAKSSTFASYCAQGTIPVIIEPFSGEIDGLRDGVQVISPRTLDAVGKNGYQACSTAAWQWQANNGVHVHAAHYRDWMLGAPKTANG